MRGASKCRREGSGDLIRPGGLAVCVGLGCGERRANASESPYSCSILAGQLGEAGRNTEGRVIRRPSGWGWEEVRAAEGGRRHCQTLWLVIGQMWRPYGGDGLEVGGRGEEDKMRGGGWLRRVEEAGRECSSPRSARSAMP